jgi:hypothetical protein
MTFVCNEGSTFNLQTEFFGLVGMSRVPLSPGSVRYRIKDIENNRVVRDWTSVSPSASIVITVIASDNVIYDKSSRNRNRRQSMSIVVQTDPGLDSQYDDEFLYEVRNLRGYES